MPRCHDTPLDAPMGFGSTRSDACRARRAPDGRWPPVPPGGTKPLQVSRRPRATRRQRFSALSGSEWADAGTDPKVGRPPVRLAGSPKTATLPVPPGPTPEGARPGSVAVIRIPRRAPGPALSRPRRAESSAGRDPEGFPPCRSVSPEGARSPAVAPHAPKSGAANPAHSPGGLAPVVRDSPAFCAHPEVDAGVGWLAAGSHARRRGRRRATRARPEGRALEPAWATPEGIASRRRPRAIRRWRRGSWLRLSSKLEAGLGPDRHRLHPNGQESPKTVLSPARRPTSRRTIRRPSVESAVVPRSPPVRVVLRRGSRSPRGRSEPKLVAGVPEPKPEDAFTPATPKRPWSPAPVTRCGR